jgi:hypothetical protein
MQTVGYDASQLLVGTGVAVLVAVAVRVGVRVVGAATVGWLVGANVGVAANAGAVGSTPTTVLSV